MAFIDKRVSFFIVFLINCILSVKSENCKSLINLAINNKFFILNATELVVFYPIDFDFRVTTYGGVECESGNCTTTNEVLYKKKWTGSLANTDLAINDEELSVAIYNSLKNNTMANFLKVYPNRFVVKSRTDKNTYLVYHTLFGVYMDITNPGCDKTKFKYRSKVVEIKGVVCKIRFLTGIRYSLDCGEITLFLNAINDNGAINHDTKCED
ncbi:Uncharacterized protein FWK35_00013820 [Aphis craccivora]|uniref:Uncharacterized protein n=1 Tax=Aphis craccivora TaxID=307492 RepID=A0A6G0Z061_APHCR|nr:Uncharacterized protein FWK35_00013820 [Aphis craccivora]